MKTEKIKYVCNLEPIIYYTLFIFEKETNFIPSVFKLTICEI